MSLGVSLIGLPDVLLLDEPTTGVDPKARRSIWDILATVRQHGTSLVLTSHRYFKMIMSFFDITTILYIKQFVPS